MGFIEKRTDVSKWLIHFVRDRDPQTDFPGDEEESDARVGNHLEPDASAISVLHEIVRIGGLLPGYSFREIGRGADSDIRTTIYGGLPAVCLTEAPLQGFAQYVQDRAQSARCAPYGVCLLKREVFAAGGRPVIYGLAGRDAPKLITDTAYERTIDTALLPLSEQFRFVAYDPGRAKPLDWTHEREWRWVATNEKRHSIWYDGPVGVGAYPGLSLFGGPADGAIFSKVGLITKTRDEAEALAASLLRYRDAEGNDFGVDYSESVLAQSFVIPLDEALKSGASRIEDLAPRYRLVASREEPSPDLVERIKAAVERAKAVSERAAGEFLVTARRTPSGHVADVCGGAWVVTDDSTSSVTAGLLACSLARPMGGEYYIVDAIGKAKGEQALSYHEAAATAACESLCADLGDIFYVHTWWD